MTIKRCISFRLNNLVTTNKTYIDSPMCSPGNVINMFAKTKININKHIKILNAINDDKQFKSRTSLAFVNNDADRPLIRLLDFDYTVEGFHIVVNFLIAFNADTTKLASQLNIKTRVYFNVISKQFASS